MLRKDLDKIFTEKVTEYINKGMVIHSFSMGGSQGEVAKVDLTDGKNVYRIYMDRTNDRIEGTYYEVFHIIVGLSKIKAYTDRTLWNSDLSILEDKIYFTHEGYITESFEEIKNIERKHYDRYKYRTYNSGIESFEVHLSKQAYSLVLKKINSIKGFKSVRKINKVVKVKTKWHPNYKYTAEVKTPSGEIRNVSLW